MSDVVIRDVPDAVLAVIDRRAGRLGLSRDEYLLRLLGQETGRSDAPATTADLRSISEMLPDLTAPGLMEHAWS